MNSSRIIIRRIILNAQSSINGAFSRKLGTYEAAFLTFFSGALLLAILILFFGEGNILKVFEAPKWQLVPFTWERMLAILLMFIALRFIYIGNKKQRNETERL
ncbi:DMT family transporter [Fictibacillus nanhaiensis]|uniref:DMT family transporter n=1 Tax=Fictibacillus nanhaiensis TaxID=742169 RepID=UPI003C1F9E9C